MNIFKYFLITIFISISVQASDSLYLSCDATSDTTTYLKNIGSDREIEKLKLMVEMRFLPDNRLLSINLQSNNPKVTVVSLPNSPEWNAENYSNDKEFFLKITKKENGSRQDVQVALNRYTGGINYIYTFKDSVGSQTQTVNGKCNKVDLKKKF